MIAFLIGAALTIAFHASRTDRGQTILRAATCALFGHGQRGHVRVVSDGVETDTYATCTRCYTRLSA